MLCQPPMSTPHPSYRRSKRPFSSLHCPSPTSHSSPHYFTSSPSPSSSDPSDDEPPHKKLAQSLTRLSLSSTPQPEPLPTKEIEMKQRKSYDKDQFTTVIESLSTTSEDEPEDGNDEGWEAPFPRDEAHVTILSEIEKRLTQFPTKVLLSGTGNGGAADTALVLYRSPESMGLPPLERQNEEDAKVATRKRIIERRRLEKMGSHVVDQKVFVADGYEADAEDWDDSPRMETASTVPNGFQGYRNRVEEDEEDEEDDGEMMDLD